MIAAMSAENVKAFEQKGVRRISPSSDSESDDIDEDVQMDEHIDEAGHRTVESDGSTRRGHASSAHGSQPDDKGSVMSSGRSSAGGSAKKSVDAGSAKGGRRASSLEDFRFIGEPGFHWWVKALRCHLYTPSIF